MARPSSLYAAEAMRRRAVRSIAAHSKAHSSDARSAGGISIWRRRRFTSKPKCAKAAARAATDGASKRSRGLRIVQSTPWLSIAMWRA